MSGDSAVFVSGHEQQRSAGGVAPIDRRRGVLGEVREGGFEQRTYRRGDCEGLEELVGYPFRRRVAGAVAELLGSPPDGSLLVGGIAQHREAGAERPTGSGLHGVEGDCSAAAALTQQLL